MSKKIILITWWTGYIGSHWVVAFENAGYKTVIIDNLINSSKSVLKWIKEILGYNPDFFEVDLRDEKKLENIFKMYDFDWVVHFAWLKAVWESCNNPLKYFDNNVVWSIKLFECMEKFNVKNIIFSSTATVYNIDNKIPYCETQIAWETSNAYSTTKFLIEKILLDLSKFSQFNIVNLRYFNPIWSHISWLIWENPEWIPNNLLPFIMKVAKWELEKLKIFWADYDTKDWTWVRDYIDINDLIEWHIKSYTLLNKNSDNWYINTINLWSWIWTSVLEILNIAEVVIWNKINFEFEKRRKWDLPEFYCNADKAKKILLWETRTGIKESITNSWKFYNK